MRQETGTTIRKKTQKVRGRDRQNLQQGKPSRPEEPREETERKRKGERQRPREHTIAEINTDVPMEMDTSTDVDTHVERASWPQAVQAGVTV